MNAYDFMKKWSGNHGTPEEWEQIVEEAGLRCKSQSTPFLRELMLAVISELEREDKQKRASNSSKF
jgi:hypothetical protein